MNKLTPIEIKLKDNSYPFSYIDHDRKIVRAIVVDEDGFFYFVTPTRNDIFGNLTFIETSGGGVEDNEDLTTALKRELKEELGVEVQLIAYLGLVSDYYNLIHRHNLNYYYLVRITSFGKKHLTIDELNDFHLITYKATYYEALEKYESVKNTKLGALIYAREVPIFKLAYQYLSENINL